MAGTGGRAARGWMSMATDLFKALTVSFKAGERIVGAGERGACMFVVNSGSVKLTRPSESSSAVELGLLEKGDFFGEQALLDGKAYAVNAEAATECAVVEIGPSVFQRMLKANPEIAVRMLRKLASRLESLEARVLLQAADEAGINASELSSDAEAAPTEALPRVERVSQGRLVMEGGSAVFPLRGNEMLVGRYDPVTEIQPEIDLTGIDTKRSVSRRHSRLCFEEGRWQVEEEVGALNGTFVNGVRLAPGRRAALSEGDVISFGMVRVVFRET